MTSTGSSTSGGRGRRPSTATTEEAFTGQDNPADAAKVEEKDVQRQAARSDGGTVLVEVVVSHGLARKGERGEVELTDKVKGLLDRGYLRRVGPETTPVSLPPSPARASGEPAAVVENAGLPWVASPSTAVSGSSSPSTASSSSAV